MKIQLPAFQSNTTQNKDLILCILEGERGDKRERERGRERKREFKPDCSTKSWKEQIGGKFKGISWEIIIHERELETGGEIEKDTERKSI